MPVQAVTIYKIRQVFKLMRYPMMSVNRAVICRYLLDPLILIYFVAKIKGCSVL